MILVPSATMFNKVNWACISVGKPGCGAVRILTAFGRLPCISNVMLSSVTSTSAPASRSLSITASMVSALVFLHTTRPPEMAPAIKNVPVSIRSGTTLCSQPVKRSTPSMTIWSEPAPVIFAPILLRKSAVSTISGSRAAFSMIVVPFASVAAIMIDKVAPTLTFSITIRVPTRRSATTAFT